MGQDGAPQPTGGSGAPSSGMTPNVAATVANVVPPLTGVVFYFLESNAFVRVHAWQNMLFGVALVALFRVIGAIVDALSLIPFLGWLALLLAGIVTALVWLAALVIWLLLLVRAFGGGRLALPMISPTAERFAADDGPSARGALAYVLGPITGFVMLQRDRDPLVRFHAWQSIILSVAWIAFWVVISILSMPLSGVSYMVLRVIDIVVSLGFLFFWLTALNKAGAGERFKVPYIGSMAEQYANRP